MKDTETVSSHVVTVVKTSLLVLASKSSMPAADSQTLLVGALPVALRVAAANHLPLALVVPANTMKPLVRPVDVPPPNHSFIVKTVPYIVANASRPNAPPAAATAATTTAATIVAAATAVAATTPVSAVIAMIAAGVIAATAATPAGKPQFNTQVV